MRVIGLLASAILAILAGAAIWLIVYGYRLFAEEDLSLADKAAGAQALAAAISLFATILLVGVTAWYAWISGRLLRQSGPVINVELSVAWVPQLPWHGSVLLGPLSSLSSGPPDERFPLPYLAAQIRNAGNLAASVLKVGVESNAGFFYAHLDAPIGPSCPFELEAHSSQTAFISVDDVITGINAWSEVMGKATFKIRAVVELGSGITERSHWEQLATP